MPIYSFIITVEDNYTRDIQVYKGNDRWDDFFGAVSLGIFSGYNEDDAKRKAEEKHQIRTEFMTVYKLHDDVAVGILK